MKNLFSSLQRYGIFFLAATAFLSCQKPVELKVAEVQTTAVESTVTTVSSGTVEAMQQATLSFGGAGRVDRIFVKLGDKVNEGQKIASQENADTTASIDQARRDFDTSKKLFAEGLISKSGLDDAKKAFEYAKSNFEKTVIVAPFSGMVSELNLQLGESPTSLNTTSKVAVRIVDLNPRIIKGNIDEMDLSKVQVGAKARIRIQSVRAKPFEGLVTKVVPFISTSKEQERTAQVELKLTSNENLMPAGASADIEIVVDSKSDAVAVPARAILGTKGKRYTYKIVNDKLQRVDVEVGIGNYEAIEIVKGLNIGDLVALPGDSIELKEGLKIKATKLTWP